MNKDKNHICPVEKAGGLDTKFRRWMQNPYKILKPYIKEGMKVLDIGCGPGFFTIAMAEMVGSSGLVIAADLQDGMLEIIHDKIKGTKIEKHIHLHKCKNDIIGYTSEIDFILAFYMIHEVPDQMSFFKETYSILKPDGYFMIVEPKLFHVSKEAFKHMLHNAERNGFQVLSQPKISLSRSAYLKKLDADKFAKRMAIFKNI